MDWIRNYLKAVECRCDEDFHYSRTHVGRNWEFQDHGVKIHWNLFSKNDIEMNMNGETAEV